MGGRLGEVGGDAVVNELRDGIVIADDDALESPAIAQPAAQQLPVRRHGYAGKIRERGHDGRNVRVDRRRERRHVHLAQRALGNVDRRVIAPGRDRAVSAIVLGHRRERIRRREVGALKAAHLRLRDARAEPRIFSRTFDDSPPTRIARNIQHGRKGHRQTVSGGFLGGLARGERPGFRIEQRCFAQRHRKQDAMSMHDVEADEQWDSEARLLHRQTLHLAHMRRPDQIEQIADRAGLDGVGRVAGDDRPGHRVAGGGHRHLPQLLRQSHRADQGSIRLI